MESGSENWRAATVAWMETLAHDLRFAVRIFLRKPVFSIIIVAVLGLGIGANTAMFSIINAVLLRPLPYKDSDRLVVVWQSTNEHRETGEWFDRYREVQHWKLNSKSFETLAAESWAVGPKSVFWQGKARKVLVIPASVELFSMLGIAAERGRTFESRDLNQSCAIVLSHSFWQSELGAPAELIGRDITVDQQACTVIGVMPKGFSFYPVETAAWSLMGDDTEYLKDPWRAQTAIFGRLRPGVSRARAQSELEILEQQIASEAPADVVLPRNIIPVVLGMKNEFTWLAGRNLRQALIVLLVTVFFVLLIACVNVANLVLAQVADRQRELAIRTSLGCGRARLIGQLLVESSLLAFAGACAGIVMAFAAVQLFRRSIPITLPPGNAVELNWQVLVFTVVISMAAAVLFGLLPAWRASGLNVNEALKETTQGLSGRGAHRARSWLVAGEVGLSLVLLSGAGLLLESLARLAATPLGFRADHLLTASIDLPEKKYSDPEQKIQIFQKIVREARTMPGALRASLSSSFYLAGSNLLAVEGRPFSPEHTAYNVAEQIVEPDFFETMGITLLRGRAFDSSDRGNTQEVAVVNQALAERYFPYQDPIGQHIKLSTPESKKPWLTIIGVVGNVKTTTVFQEMGYVKPPAVYRPLEQQPLASMALLVRTQVDPDLLGNPVERVVRSLDDQVTVSNLKPMDDRLYALRAEPRFRTVLLGAFAALALLLAALGIYGLLMQSVIRRTKEIGIRMALGASRGNVIRGVLRQAITTVSAGIVLGLLTTAFLVRFINRLLYEVRPGNPLVLGGVSALLILIAMAASYVPARRATGIDPLQALRTE